jgi:hypothetical protein
MSPAIRRGSDNQASTTAVVGQPAALEALTAALAAEAPCWASTAGSLEPYSAPPGLELTWMVAPGAERRKEQWVDG